MTSTISNASHSPDRAALIDEAADRLQYAANTGKPCSPIRELIGASITLAYDVQSKLTARRIMNGATVVGRKIGLTSEAVQRQLRVSEPDFGVLFDDMWIAQANLVPIERLLQPKVEAEVAFVLGHDLIDGPLDVAQIRSAIDHAVAAIEVVDSRVENWDIWLSDTVADNASSGMFVLGETRVSLEDLEPSQVTMSMSVDGDCVSVGSGEACMGDPLNAVVWLARAAREYGEPLRAGQVILSGALGPMVPVTAGAVVTAEVSGLGSVTATFSGGERS